MREVYEEYKQRIVEIMTNEKFVAYAAVFIFFAALLGGCYRFNEGLWIQEERVTRIIQERIEFSK